MGHSHIAVKGDVSLSQVEHQVVDGDHHLVDCGAAVHLALLNLHQERHGRLRHQVVTTAPGELVHFPVKRLEVVPAPGAADGADMADSCGCEVVEERHWALLFYI